MQTFEAGVIYVHMRETHGGIYDAENAPVPNVDINEQLEALREAERARRPPGPVPALFPLGYANLDAEHAQQQARLQEARLRVQQLQERRAAEALQEQERQRAQFWQRHQDARRDELRREELRRAELLRGEEARRRREEGRWCIVM
jgi:hypothetical protein